MKEIVLDTETTGLSVKDGHRIVEIGCIELEDLIPTKNTFHCYLNPERKVSEKAFEVHGYSDEFLSDKKKFKEIANDFLDFIGDKKIIIHNAEFDIGHKIDNFRRKKHTALIDCELLSKVYINLIDQKEPTLNLSNDSALKQNLNESNTNYYKKVVLPSAEEIKNHEEFLKKSLKKNFF